MKRCALWQWSLSCSLVVVFSTTACAPSSGDPGAGKDRGAVSLGQIFSNIVQNGAFTNVYVYPTPSTQTWEQHLAGLRPIAGDQAAFSRAAIDAATDRLMSTAWPSYFGGLYQYHCGLSTDCGINPPQFFGSGVASQACVDAALADANNGVLEWSTVRSLANCHLDGMDPSPQVNLIFSPDIAIAQIIWPGPANGPEMCTTSPTVAYHAWGINTPNFAALPTSEACAGNFAAFTQSLSHEASEILTDPAGDGYGDFPNYTAEAADLCGAGDSLTVMGGDSWARYWSNSDGDCEPRFDALAGSTSFTWSLGSGSPLVRLTGSAPDFTVAVPAARPSTSAAVTQLVLVIQTGGDDLGGGTNANVELTFSGGSSTTTNISGGHHWDNGQTHSVVLTLPSTPLPASAITGLVLHKDTSGDNWNVDKLALLVSVASGSAVTPPPTPIVHTWLDASELPLVRFTGSVHDKALSLTPTDLGKGVQALSLLISTGNDNLNGGGSAGDNCDVIVQLASGATITVNNVNAGATWDGWSKHAVPIPIPAGGLRGGDITGLTLHTGFSGGDNWNVERVQLFATLDPAQLLDVTILSPSLPRYLHSATLRLGYVATDVGGPGVASLAATMDGASTVGGLTLADGLDLPLLTTLPLGHHTFSVTATDAWGNAATKSVAFDIVATPFSLREDVLQLARAQLIEWRFARELLELLEEGAEATAHHRCERASRVYQAFIEELEEQGRPHGPGHGHGHRQDHDRGHDDDHDHDGAGRIAPAAVAVLEADARYVSQHCP